MTQKLKITLQKLLVFMAQCLSAPPQIRTWRGRAIVLGLAGFVGIAVALSAAVYFEILPPNFLLSKLAATQQPPSALEARIASRPRFDREKILDDVDQRIDDEFLVPSGLRDRVGFWFDIYSKYDSLVKVIHDSDRPWIIYKVMDTSEIVNADEPRVKWLRVEKADKIVKAEADRIREALRSVARKKTLASLDEYEALVVEALKPLGEDVQGLAARAASEVRIQTGQRDFFEEGLRISPFYLAEMENIFARHKLPIELTRLPFVESSFNKFAKSKVGATGIWQFMDGTGRKFLTVNDTIDERISPFKATEAAARLLKENHLILYRSWPLALTAWNHGPGGIRKAAQAVGSRDLTDIVANYRSATFDFASSNFYSEFLAALHTERYQDRIFGPLEKDEPLAVSFVRLKRAVRVSEVIRSSDLADGLFLRLNPELRGLARADSPIPSGFRILVPTRVRTIVERTINDPQKVAAQERRRFWWW